MQKKVQVSAGGVRCPDQEQLWDETDPCADCRLHVLLSARGRANGHRTRTFYTRASLRRPKCACGVRRLPNGQDEEGLAPSSHRSSMSTTRALSRSTEPSAHLKLAPVQDLAQPQPQAKAARARWPITSNRAHSAGPSPPPSCSPTSMNAKSTRETSRPRSRAASSMAPCTVSLPHSASRNFCSRSTCSE